MAETTKFLNKDMEMAVIGSLFLFPEYALINCRNMDPRWFYESKHKSIFEVLKSKIEAGEPVDLNLAAAYLTDAGILGEVGGMVYLSETIERCSTPAHIETYIGELEKLFLSREVERAAGRVKDDPSQANIEILKSKSQDRDSIKTRGIIDIKDCLPVIDELTGPLAKGIYDVFGMKKMDEYFNGTRGGEILTLAARPGVGKTVLATHMALNFARKYKEPVLYFSTEMSHEETLQRILSPLSRVPGWKFRKRWFDKEGKDVKAIAAAADELLGLKFFMVDKPSPTFAEIRSAMIATRCKLVIVDYIQRINLEVGREGRPAAIGAAMQGIKNACRDLDCIGVVVSALDREIDHLTGRQRPQLADLKGSGDIEQESDAVVLIWKHNKKDRDTKKDTVPELDNVKAVEAIHAKNRHGKGDVSVQLIFDEKFIEFLEWRDSLAGNYQKVGKKGESNGNQNGNNPGWGTEEPEID